MRAPLWALGAVALLTSCGGSERANGSGRGGSPGGSGGSAAGGSAMGGSATGGDSGSSGSPGAGGTVAGGGGIPATGGTAGAGSGGSGGSDAGASGSGGSGTAGTAGMAGGAGAPVATCTENPIRTAPPPGKEMFHTDPIDDRFPFASHWMGIFSDSADANATRYVSMTSFADLDHDGDLDFASGQRNDVGGGMVFWEYCGPDHWVRHNIGTGHTSAAGGNAADVDGDGWVDLLAGNSWYKNPGPPTGMWTRYTIGAPGAEELIVGEVTGDTRPDVLYVWNSINPQFWTPGTDPTSTWTMVELTRNMTMRQQQGGAIADIDGDGRNDIVVGYQYWYRNVNADGRTWEPVPLVSSGFDSAPLTHVGDIDGDGDTDVVMCTHFGSSAGSARVAWAENQDGKGTSWALHPIATGKSFTHAIVAADFDNDDDLDVFVGQNIGEQWIFENTDGAGTFVEHRIAADSRGHEARVGDVDCDGDLDIAGKPWGQQNEGGESQNPPRDHVYLQNMLVERGGTPRFTSTPYEILPATKARTCR